MGGSDPTPRPVRVVVVEDHAVLRESLELALVASGYDVPHLDRPSGRLAATIADIAGARPDIALVDIDRTPENDGLRLVAPLARNGVQVVAMTSSSSRDRWGQAVRYGAVKVHSRSQPLGDIFATVQRLAADLPVMTREERDDLASAGDRDQQDQRETLARLESLTPREATILGELIEGRPVRAIAERAGVSESTVRTQVKSILAKLDVSSQLGAVGRARSVGWRPTA